MAPARLAHRSMRKTGSTFPHDALGRRCQPLLKEIAIPPGRKILQLSEAPIAETLVEVQGLDVERIEPCRMAASPPGLILRDPDKPAGDALSAQAFGDENQLDREPFPTGAAPKTADDLLR